MSFIPKNIPKRRRSGPFTKLVALIESKPTSDKLLLRLLFFVCIGSLLTGLVLWSKNNTVTTPTGGGILIEGIVGIPRFVNPVLAVTRADQDMTAIIYRGLMKIDPAGKLVPDIADSVTVSEDGRTYNIILKNNVRFHDGMPLTARDVAFTIGLIQNADLKSPLRGNWSDVVVEEIGEYELNIVIEEAYTPFIENFTLGILPRHIWSDLPIEQIPFSQRNTDPIGTGPFRIKEIQRNDSGLIDSYDLVRFTDGDQHANLDGVKIRFYQNEDDLVAALAEKTITSTVYVPLESVSLFNEESGYQIIAEPLPRVFGIFFNQNHSADLRDIGVRRALSLAIDRRELVKEVLHDYGVPTTSPVPQNEVDVESNSPEAEASTTTAQLAIDELEAAGWAKDPNGIWEKRIAGEMVPLSITLRTANNPLFEATTQAIARMWREIGVEVQIEQYEQSDLLQAVIRPRDFEALLFGLDMSRSIDLYPFWHSSQREDPGLNIAQYANIDVDSLLEKTRSSQDSSIAALSFAQAVSTIEEEYPAVFLYNPSLIYIATTDLMASDITRISKPHERFMNISDWYVHTDDLWGVFK